MSFPVVSVENMPTLKCPAQGHDERNDDSSPIHTIPKIGTYVVVIDGCLHYFGHVPLIRIHLQGGVLPYNPAVCSCLDDASPSRLSSRDIHAFRIGC